MPRPQFSEMLVTRRRQLGLSISQASQVLRLKEQVLIAFEEGDFDHIPKSGYAQGMLSSYARYLGLNPRVVVDQFQADLDEYMENEHGGYTNPQDNEDYLGPRKYLPTSGGPAGDMGAFATTSQPHSRQQSSPLVTRRYVGSIYDEQERSYGYDVEDQYYSQGQSVGVQGSSYSSQRAKGNTNRARRRTGTTSNLGRDNVTTRRAPASSLVDDGGGYDNQVIDYEPRVTRGSSSSGRGTPHRQGGLVGTVMSYFSNTRNLIMAGTVLAVTILFVLIIAGMRSCAKQAEPPTSKTIPVTQSDATSTAANTQTAPAANATATTPADPNAAANATANANAAAGGAAAATTAPKQTLVQVTVAAGQVSWVEILCDGDSKMATTVTGPWTETYDVHDSITIEAGNTSAVEVTENGKVRPFDSKTSGLGTMTIKGTPVQETPADDKSGNNADGSKKDEDPDAKTTGNEQEGKKSDSEKKGERNEEEFLYTYGDYDIYYNSDSDVYYFYDDDGNRYNAADGSPL